MKLAIVLVVAVLMVTSCKKDYCKEAYGIMTECQFGLMAGEAMYQRRMCDSREPVNMFMARCLVEAGHGCAPARYFGCMKLTKGELDKGNLRVKGVKK